MVQTVIDFESGIIDGTAGGLDNKLQVGDFIFTIQATGAWTASISNGRFNFQEAPGSDPFVITISTASGTLLDYVDYQIGLGADRPLLAGNNSAAVFTDNTFLPIFGGFGIEGRYLSEAFGGVGNLPTPVPVSDLTITDIAQPGDDNAQMTLWLDNVTFETLAVPGATRPSLTATPLMPTFTENGFAQELFSNVSAQTRDGGQTFTGMTLKVTNVTQLDVLSVGGAVMGLWRDGQGSLAVGGNYAVTVDGTTSTVTLSGMSLDDDIMNNVIERMFYHSNSNAVGTTPKSITITEIKDSGASSNVYAPNITSMVTINAINDVHTGGVSISGDTTEDRTLTAISTLADPDGMGTFQYQWQRKAAGDPLWISIAGANQSTYRLGDADVGATIAVVVSYIDGQGFTEVATSAPTVPITNINDVPTFGGTSSAALIETDAALNTGGKLTIIDPDLGEAGFRAQNNVIGTAGYGTFSIDATGVWTYQMNGPHNEFVLGVNYTDTLTVLSTDGTATTISVVITGTDEIVVVPPAPTNRAPVLSSANADAAIQTGTALDLTIGDGHFTDPDGNDLDYVMTVNGGAAPAWMTFDAETGRITGTPDAADAGTYAISILASDGSLSSASDGFVLTVSTPANPEGKDVIGNRKDNKLVGDELDNLVDGRRGNDRLTGRDGADTFVFGKAYGRDVIRDFHPEDGDVIDLSGAVGILSFRDLMRHHVEDIGNQIRITADDGAVLIIRNFEPEDLRQEMFVF